MRKTTQIRAANDRNCHERGAHIRRAWHGVALALSVMSATAHAQVNWTPPEPLSKYELSEIIPTGLNGDPSLVTDGRGNWVAVWTAMSEPTPDEVTQNSNIVVVHSNDDGATWSLPSYLNSNAATDTFRMDDGPAQLATDGDGCWVAMWTHFEEHIVDQNPVMDWYIGVARSNDNGATWTPFEVLDGSAAGDSTLYFNPPGIAGISTDESGHWLVRWYNRRVALTNESIIDLYISGSTDHGVTWNPVGVPVMEFPVSDPIGALRFAHDRAGTWIAYASAQDRSNLPGQIDFDIQFARSIDNGLTWSAPAWMNSTWASDIGTRDDGAAIAADGAGNWVAVWSSGDYSLLSDIVVSRSTDNGAHWSAPFRLDTRPVTEGVIDNSPAIATDGTNWVVVWSALVWYVTSDSDLAVSRSADTGVTWTTPTWLNTDAATDSGDGPDDELGATIATDRLGGWLVAWTRQDLAGNNAPRSIMLSRSAGTWVKFGSAEIENGSMGFPFNTLAEAIAAASTNRLITIRGDGEIVSSPETPRISKRLTLKAVSGAVAIGEAP